LAPVSHTCCEAIPPFEEKMNEIPRQVMEILKINKFQNLMLHFQNVKILKFPIFLVMKAMIVSFTNFLIPMLPHLKKGNITTKKRRRKKKMKTRK